MSFALYAVGFLIVIAGLVRGAHLMHLPPHWIAVGAIVLTGNWHCHRRPKHSPERSVLKASVQPRQAHCVRLTSCPNSTNIYSFA